MKRGAARTPSAGDFWKSASSPVGACCPAVTAATATAARTEIIICFSWTENNLLGVCGLRVSGGAGFEGAEGTSEGFRRIASCRQFLV